MNSAVAPDTIIPSLPVVFGLIGLAVICGFMFGIVTSRKTDKDQTGPFTFLAQRSRLVPVAIVACAILAAFVLRLAGKLNDQVAVVILSGAAGYIIENISDTQNGPFSDGE